MGNEIVQVEPRWLAPEEIRDQVNHIQRIMQAVMKEDHHYGKIPGTPKPSLWKPGAEKLLSTFRLTASHSVEDLSDSDHRRYRVTVSITTHDGIFVCDGVGSASTEEEKYCWRAAICDEEFDATDEMRRRIKYKKGRGGSVYTVNQVRTNPADLDNTVLKMAAKRGLIGGVLLATAAGDIFAQDIEDLPPELLENDAPAVEMPKPKAAPAPQPPPPTQDAPPPEDPGEIPSEEGVIERTHVKTGKGARGEWTKTGIKLDTGNWYSTFDTTIGEEAEQNTGKLVKIGYKETKYGRELLSFDILETAEADDGEPPF